MCPFLLKNFILERMYGTIINEMLGVLIIRSIANKELLFEALDYTRAGVLITDPQQEDNPIIYANQGFFDMTGYSAAEIMGQNCRFLQGEETDKQEVMKLKQAIEKRESSSVILYNYTKDGTGFWNSLTVDHLYIEKEDQHFFIGVQKDVTHEKEIEASLLESQQEIESLACPIVPVIEGIAVLPLIGKMNRERFSRVLTVTTDAIVKKKLKQIIVDLSGLTHVDDAILVDLSTLQNVIRLQGANLVVTGISPEMILHSLQTNELLYMTLHTEKSVQDVISKYVVWKDTK